MTKLAYGNIFESIEPDASKADRLLKTSNALIAFAGGLGVAGFNSAEIRDILQAAKDAAFSRINRG